MKRLAPLAFAAAGLLLNTWAFAAAEAEPRSTSISVAFTYNPNAAPEDIYASLQRKADNACKGFGVRAVRTMQTERDCAAGLVSAAVARIGRADIAVLHKPTVLQLAGS